MPDNEPCPCGSGRNYAACCGRYHTRRAWPPTAEALMRARYSAYVVGALDFLIETDEQPTDRAALASWSRQAHFYELKILSIHQGKVLDKKGVVTFQATYEEDGTKKVHRERSFFVKRKGRWYYRRGEAI